MTEEELTELLHALRDQDNSALWAWLDRQRARRDDPDVRALTVLMLMVIDCRTNTNEEQPDMKHQQIEKLAALKELTRQARALANAAKAVDQEYAAELSLMAEDTFRRARLTTLELEDLFSTTRSWGLYSC